MNVRDVRITETLAVPHDALMLAAPAVKLIIAGTRPDRLQREERDRHAHRVRQHHADRSAWGSERGELGAKHLRRQDQLAVAEFDPQRIGDRRPTDVPDFVRVGQGLEQRANSCMMRRVARPAAKAA